MATPAALWDLTDRLESNWFAEVADPDSRGIRVGCISKLAMSDAEQLKAFPSGIKPIQAGDHGEVMNAMGRPALRVRFDAGPVFIDLISTHLKSKLLTYPGGRFALKDEGERARYAFYALHRRAAEAAAVRAAVDGILEA